MIKFRPDFERLTYVLDAMVKTDHVTSYSWFSSDKKNKVRITRKRYGKDKKPSNDFSLTFGKLNYREREFCKNNKDFREMTVLKKKK